MVRGGKVCECVISSIIERVTVVDELDDDLILSEQIDQPSQRRCGISSCKPLSHAPLTTAGENRPVPIRARCEIFQVVDRSALLATAQLSPGDGSGKAVIA